jgi:hypothetical protein
MEDGVVVMQHELDVGGGRYRGASAGSCQG